MNDTTYTPRIIYIALTALEKNILVLMLSLIALAQEAGVLDAYSTRYQIPCTLILMFLCPPDTVILDGGLLCV